jgi:hypothetical protein
LQTVGEQWKAIGGIISCSLKRERPYGPSPWQNALGMTQSVEQEKYSLGVGRFDICVHAYDKLEKLNVKRIPPAGSLKDPAAVRASPLLLENGPDDTQGLLAGGSGQPFLSVNPQ